MSRAAAGVRSRAPSILGLLAILGSGAVQAQPPSGLPRTQPIRDVVVLYRIEGQALDLIPGGVQGPVRLSWDAAGQRVRAETEGRNQIALLDLRNHAGQAIDTSLRIVLPLKIREKDLQPLTLAGARLAPRGRDTVAGLPCNAYVFTSPQGPGDVCLTPDGVPLRGHGIVDGKPGSFTAISVAYGALPSSLFEPPTDYIALGNIPGSAGGSRGGLSGLIQRFGNSPELQSLLRNSR